MAAYWVEISLGIDWFSVGTDEDNCRLLERQYKRAMKVQRGDIILHHVNRVNCWAGYSHVIEPVSETSDPQTAEEKAYPFYLRTRRGIWLTTPEEFFITSTITGLSHDNWHRQGYVQVKPTDAALIMKAVNDASGRKINIADDAFKEFNEKLKVLRDNNASKLCKEKAGYRCTLCGTVWSSWCDDHLPVDVSKVLKNSTGPESFVHAHHIKKVEVGGNAAIDNLLCVCPNCHHMVQRLDEVALRELLCKLQK